MVFSVKVINFTQCDKY